jgi:hypothetical protein
VQLEMSALGQKRTWAYASACARPSSALGRQCADVNVKNHLVLAPDAANSMLLANVGFAAVQKPTFYRKRAQVAEGFAKSCRDETAKQMFQRVAGRWRELARLAGSRKSSRASSKPKKGETSVAKFINHVLQVR